MDLIEIACTLFECDIQQHTSNPYQISHALIDGGEVQGFIQPLDGIVSNDVVIPFDKLASASALAVAFNLPVHFIFEHPTLGGGMLESDRAQFQLENGAGLQGHVQEMWLAKLPELEACA